MGDLVAEGEVTGLLLTDGAVSQIADTLGVVAHYFWDVRLVNILNVLPFPLRGSQKMWCSYGGISGSGDDGARQWQQRLWLSHVQLLLHE